MTLDADAQDALASSFLATLPPDAMDRLLEGATRVLRGAAQARLAPQRAARAEVVLRLETGEAVSG